MRMVKRLRSPSRPAMTSKLSLRELVTLSLLGALLFVVQVILGFLPNIELVSLLVIVYTRVYGWKALYPVYLFVALEGFFYGITTWFIHYLYIWALLVLVVRIFRCVEMSAVWVLINTAFGFLFGALCAVAYLFMGGLSTAIAYWISGIPFDLLHAGGNFITALVLYKPLYHLLLRLQKS